MQNLQAIYSEAAARAPWETAPIDEGGARASVRQFDEVVGAAIEALEWALGHADLAEASANLRGLRAVSDTFGAAEWMLDPPSASRPLPGRPSSNDPAGAELCPQDPPGYVPGEGALSENGVGRCLSATRGAARTTRTPT